ncbi:thiol-disulfide oxidoreductase DCC family protein [Haloarchaeobius sp. DFWS5]|uniref:thiol-disulfide oxidoreductase DCC family protein n=1 Tax=Haloarchaeobius sp. DFWS5 TaxID=3446114 RepID=UPI003EB6ED78
MSRQDDATAADESDSAADADESDTGVDLDVLGDTPVLLFDGVCNLCNGAVQFVIERDDAGKIHFASLQSDAGARLLERAGLSPDQRETMVLVEGDDVYTKSSAAIRLAELLGGVYRVATLGRVVPRFVRDRVYDFVAAHRYQWFGKKDQCMVPEEDVSGRFLD